MFFGLSKLFWGLAAPLNLVALLIVGGMVGGALARRSSWRAGWKVTRVTGAILLFAFGATPAGYNGLVFLEGRYPPLQTAVEEKIDGIILLGGAVETTLPPRAGVPMVNEQADRILEFLRLARAYPQARLVVSGGTTVSDPGAAGEAEILRPFLEQAGLSGRAILCESTSRNTFENALFSKAMARPPPGSRWALVTSAFHMPRSVAVFESAGWTVVPAPTDFRTQGRMIVLPRRFDILGAMRDSTVFVKEVLGYVAYGLSGKIAFPWRGGSLNSAVKP